MSGTVSANRLDDLVGTTFPDLGLYWCDFSILVRDTSTTYRPYSRSKVEQYRP